MAKVTKASAAEDTKKTKKVAKAKVEKVAKPTKATKAPEVVEEMAPVAEVAQDQVQAPEAETPKKKAKRVSEAELTEEEKAQSSDVIERLIKSSKQQIIIDYALKDGDTGSPEVQIALATQKVFNLADHLGENPKDNHSRRGLLKVIAKRRRILHYLQGKDEARYKNLTKKLGLKK